MIRTPFTGNIDQFKASADIIEEVSDTVVYFGFCEPGTTDTAHPNWAIMKIIVSGTVQPITTQFLWADGQSNCNLKWDDRATLTYSYRKF
ncbi:MAG: hypothetical protein WCR72_16520 [Bacteroidota bacterium]